MRNQSFWKLAFIILLGLNICFVAVLSYFLISPQEKKSPALDRGTEDWVEADFSMDKQSLEKLINYYILKEYDGGRFSYRLSIKNEVELIGQLEIFNEVVEMKMTFNPLVMENGDLALFQTSVQIGKFQLPVSYLMNFLNKIYHFPGWVEIYPNEKLVHIALSRLKMKNGVGLRAEEFDLSTGKIRFSLLFPN